MAPKQDGMRVMATAHAGWSDGACNRQCGGRDGGHGDGSESKSVGDGTSDGTRVR